MKLYFGIVGMGFAWAGFMLLIVHCMVDLPSGIPTLWLLR